MKVNIETGHAVLAGHSFEHEIVTALALGIFGSVDANRNDYQSGWDTDQFPNNVPETALALYYILQGGGLGNGGFNFDSKIRRQSLDPADLIAGHVGGMDVLARGLLAAAAMIEDGGLAASVKERYAGWDDPRGAGDALLRPRDHRRARRQATASTRSRARAGRSGWRTGSTASSDQSNRSPAATRAPVVTLAAEQAGVTTVSDEQVGAASTF